MTTAPLDIEDLVLRNGSHSDRTEGVCLMEAAAWFAGEPHSDAPQCVSPYLRQFGITLNDRANDTQRQDLRRFIPLVVGTAGDGLDDARRWLAADHVTRVTLPKWLDAAGLTEHATAVRSLPAITDRATYAASRPVVRAARDAAYQARNEKFGGSLWDFVYAKVRAAVAESLKNSTTGKAAATAATATERFGDLVSDSWSDALRLYERLIAPTA